MDYYLSKDGYVETADKYEMFNEWCKKEGVIMPKLEYPATFENGMIGARCTEDIPSRTAFLFVPYKMMLSVSKLRQHEVLGKIIKDYPEVFSAEHAMEDYE